MSQVRVRFAPSPTGSPHVGTIRTAMVNWLYARHHDGVFILRIEDTDRERTVPGAFEEILSSMRWLGLDWDEGPEANGDKGPYVQSERVNLYREMAQVLLDNGAAYECWCSKERLDQVREAQKAQNMSTGYDRHCLRLSDEEKAKLKAEGAPSVIRLKVDRTAKTGWEDTIRGYTEFDNKQVDDQVLLKADGWPTYHLANVVDDHLMEVTHVIRGEDWISSTPKHLMLYNAFGWKSPVFAHVSLLLGPDKSKLSKRHGTTTFSDFINEGYLPEALFNFLSLLGWSPGDDQEIISVEDTVQKFTLEACLKSGAVFDFTKLKWMNGEYIRSLSNDKLAEHCLPFLTKAGLVPEKPTEDELSYIGSVVSLEQERLKLLSEIVDVTEFFFKEIPTVDVKAWDKWMGKDYVPEMLKKQIEMFSVLTAWDHDSVESVIRSIAEQLGLGAGNIIHPTRVAVSGRTVGPGLFEMIVVLGRERILSRLAMTLKAVENGTKP